MIIEFPYDQEELVRTIKDTHKMFIFELELLNTS